MKYALLDSKSRMDQATKNQPQASVVPPAKPGTGSLMHDFNTKDTTPMPVQKVIFSLLLVLLLGLGSGFGVAKMTATSSSTGKSALGNIVSGTQVEKGKTYGSNDRDTYKDEAEGVMKEGGHEEGGQYHLERPGGESQNVYLTSSTVDLSQFIDRKVTVWGQTQAAQVGWLMDVGGVKVLE